jgi:hypothetical protein
LETKKWQARGEEDKKNLQNKKKLQDLFKNARVLLVNTVKPGGNGASKDGNIAIWYF